MATFYLDPVGGNDANAGTSFATRWQSFNSGATVARIAPGDTIRVISSPDPTALGDATWADGSRTVTLANAVTATINDATTQWTASSNAGIGTGSNRKLGTNSSTINVTSTFTTGKVAYIASAASDYSAYQQVSFWIMQTSGTLASNDGEISIKLCSDTLGATAVNTVPIPRIRALNQWQVVTVDTGGALGSSIQSIGFYVNTDRAAQAWTINHIIACKAPSSPDSLALSSLIGKNSGSEGWYAIDSISGTTVTLQTAGPNYNLGLAGTPSGYAGVSETVTTYKREPLRLPPAFVATTNTAIPWGSMQDSGTAGSPITISGGWDSTNMSTQVGDTYVSGVNGWGVGLYFGGMSNIAVSKLNLFGFYTGAQLNAASDNVSITASDISCNSAYNVLVQSQSAGGPCPTNVTLTVDNLNCAGQAVGASLYFNRSAKNVKLTAVNMNSNWNYGIVSLSDTTSTSNPWVVSQIKVNATNVRRNATYGLFLGHLDQGDFTVGTVSNNGVLGVRLHAVNSTTGNAGVANTKFKITSAMQSNGTNGISSFNARNITFDFTGATVSGHTSSGALFISSTGTTVIGGSFSGHNSNADLEADGGSDVTVIGASLGSTTPYVVWEPGSAKASFHNYQGTAGDHRTYTGGGSIMTNTTTRHTASGVSWAMSPTSTTYASQDWPLVLPLGPVAVAAGSLVTATVWVNRSNTGITTKLVAKGGQIAGVTSDVVATAAGSASTWEQLTVTFTPSEAGVIELEVQAYGGTTHTVYVDDLEVTQA